MKIDLRYEHYCDNCVYLGRHDHTYKNLERKIFDLYCCKNEFETNFLARYSDKGPDYVSGDLKTVKEDMNDPLYEAKNRAIKLNLI